VCPLFCGLDDALIDCSIIPKTHRHCIDMNRKTEPSDFAGHILIMFRLGIHDRYSRIIVFFIRDLLIFLHV
jgi:hypothetical protein